MAMTEITIREIKSDEVAAYKAFLKAGLEQDEQYFRITPDDDEREGFPTCDMADSFTLGAYSGAALAGIVSFERDGRMREKLRHKGILFRMYESDENRGMGIARQLITALLHRVRQLPDIEQVNLTVISGNHARLLYESFGFTTFGRELRAVKWKGNYYDEEQMVLFLNQ